MEKATLNIPDISCDHCIQTIQKTTTALPGVKWVSGNAETKVVELEYDPAQTPLTRIEEALAEEEYPVAK